MPEEPEATQFGRSLTAGLQSLPVLGDDPYMRMQALNLGIVDAFLVDLETQLLHEYHELDRTPTPSATFVSALSQMWVFGVYELLRTWRQRVREIILFVEKLGMVDQGARDHLIESQKANLASGSPYVDRGHDLRWMFFERAITDEEFVQQLHTALDSLERVFRRIEALRIHLAKHELPKAKGSAALAPGYGRIHTETGSIYYQVLLRGNEVDVISRRDIADDCRDLIRDKTHALLPTNIREQLRHIQELGYGVKRVKVRINDGSTYDNVFVAWDREIIAVGNLETLPFNAGEVVEVCVQNN